MFWEPRILHTEIVTKSEKLEWILRLSKEKLKVDSHTLGVGKASYAHRSKNLRLESRSKAEYGDAWAKVYVQVRIGERPNLGLQYLRAFPWLWLYNSRESVWLIFCIKRTWWKIGLSNTGLSKTWTLCRKCWSFYEKNRTKMGFLSQLRERRRTLGQCLRKWEEKVC